MSALFDVAGIPKLFDSGALPKISNGTDNIDMVAYKDLMFYLPYTKEHLQEGIPFSPTFAKCLDLSIIIGILYACTFFHLKSFLSTRRSLI